MMVIGDQAWLHMKWPFLLKLFLFRFTSVASITSRLTYPDAMSNIEVPLTTMPLLTSLVDSDVYTLYTLSW